MSRLEETALHLERRGEYRKLIRFVVAWSQLQEPTTPAQLAVVRAFVDLGMLDRAWVRLERVLEDELCGVEAHELAARVFLARGWHNRARGYVVKALEATPESPQLLALLAELSQVGPDGEQSPDDDDSVESMAQRAHRAMCQGSFVRARALLERAKRQSAEHPRVRDLLWAMEGEYEAQEPLGELVRLWGPGLSQPLPDLLSFRGEPEHTVSASKNEVREVLGEPEAPMSSPAFQSLFRDLKPPTPLPLGTPDASEVTAVSTLRRLDEGAVPVGFATDSGEDTQIQLVIRKDDDSDDDTDIQPAPASGPPPRRASSDLGFEDEDDDLIIVTRRDDDNLEPDPTTDFGMRLDYEQDRPSMAAAQLEDEGASWVKPADLPTVPPAPRRPAEPTERASGTPPWALVAVVVVGGAALFLGVFFLVLAGRVVLQLM